MIRSTKIILGGKDLIYLVNELSECSLVHVQVRRTRYEITTSHRGAGIMGKLLGSTIGLSTGNLCVKQHMENF